MEKQERLPEWLRRPIQTDRNYVGVQQLLSENGLHTVCEDAKCPNRHECWNKGTATIMILGSVCSRNCRFCNIATGQPDPVDEQEPGRVADAVFKMALRHVVITSVTRDDLPDGGARMFARTIEAIKKRMPPVSVEVLTPDFQGSKEQLYTVLEASPNVFNHNIETVMRLQKSIRSGASYERSMRVLQNAAEFERGSIRVKSGLMLGLGEREEEVFKTLVDLYEHGCRMVTIGQYMAPTRDHIHTKRFVHPDEFVRWEEVAMNEIGFEEVASGPLVRSSYRAEKMIHVDPKG